MNNASNAEEAAKYLRQDQKSILESLYQSESSLPIHFFDSDKTIIFKLQNRGLVEIQNEQLSLTTLASDVAAYCQRKLNELKSPEPSDENKACKQQRLEKGNRLLDLYKDCSSYQDIGNHHGLSQMTVMRTLKINPAFHEYLKERKEAAAAAKREEKKRISSKKEYAMSSNTSLIL
jgi:tRNA U34 5-carboxymethylaminomethyl modifying enzyme MnmG/GidA